MSYTVEIIDPTATTGTVLEVGVMDVEEEHTRVEISDQYATAEVDVTDVYSDTVEVSPEATVLVDISEVGQQGPPGPPGAPGSGAGGTSFEQAFAVAATTWTITHNLGYTPAVTAYDASGRAVRGHVESNGPVQTIISFAVPVAGRAALS